MKLILASSSPYRAALMKKTGLPFESVRPAVDEEQLKKQFLAEGFSPSELAKKLSAAKGESARKILKDPDTIIVSGDQLVEIDGEILGKPGNFQKAKEQLEKLSGRTHRLLTAITLITPKTEETHLSITTMSMRILTASEITHYLQKDTPYDCPGSYKIEENGIPLFNAITGEDFTSIQGIPMIWLCNKLKEHNSEFFRT